jgi:hypothetical protein
LCDELNVRPGDSLHKSVFPKKVEFQETDVGDTVEEDIFEKSYKLICILIRAYLKSHIKTMKDHLYFLLLTTKDLTFFLYAHCVFKCPFELLL